MARPQEPDVKITEALQPTGIPETTFVHAAPVAESPLHEVAKALAPLSSDLTTLAIESGRQLRQDEIAKGEAAFWDRHADGAGEAVATGAIPAQASPHFMTGYGRMAGLNDAQNVGQTIGPDYQELDKNQDDPKAFDKWFFPYVKGKLNPSQANNPAYLRSWATGIQSLHGQYAAKYVQDRSEAVKSGAAKNFQGNVGNTIDDQYLGAGGEPDYAKMADSIQTIREAAYRMGQEPATVDKSIIDIVALKAIKYKNPALLDVLNIPPAAPGASSPGPYETLSISLGDTEHGVHTKLSTAQTIEARVHQDRERQHTEDTRQDKLAHDSALGTVMQGWSKDTSFQPTPEQTAAIVKHDPTFLAKMATLRENILKGNVVEDPATNAKLYEDIAKTNGGMGAVLAAIGRGDLKTKESIKGAVEYANLVENYDRSGGPFKITQDPAFKSLEQAVVTHTKDPKLFGSMFAELGMTDAGRTALNDARREAMSWQLKNPAATPQQRQEFLYGLQERILKNIAPGAFGSPTADLPGTKPTYTPITPGGSSPPAPTAPAPAPVVPAPQQPAPGQPQRPVPASPSPEIPAAIQKIGTLPAPPTMEQLPGLGIPQPVIDRINEIAGQRNIPPQQVLQKMWEGGRKRSDAGNPDAGQTPGGTLGIRGGLEQPSVVSLPGGGRVELHGVDPQIAQSMTDWARRLSSSPEDARAQLVGAGREWLAGSDHMAVAEQFLGMKAKQHAAALSEFFKTAGGNLNPAATAWCARFANAVLTASGHTGTGSDRARSFLGIGTKVEPKFAQAGDIIVFPRGGSGEGKGHVGFVKRVDLAGDTVEVLAGNQEGGAVSVAKFKLSTALGVRRIDQKHAMGDIPGDNDTQTA